MEIAYNYRRKTKNSNLILRDIILASDADRI